MPGRPFFTRRNDCLECHVSYATLGVAGMLVRSSVPSLNGVPLRQLGDYLTDHRSPYEVRWGGWYATGKSPTIRHLGNAMVRDSVNAESATPSENLPSSLKGKLDVDGFLSP